MSKNGAGVVVMFSMLATGCAADATDEELPGDEAAVGEEALASTCAPPDPGAGTSSETPYLVPLKTGVSFHALLTVGDVARNGYKMVGVPDGLGAFGEHDARTFTLLMNHELEPSQGAVHAHGATGTFVSKWTIDRRSGRVLTGEDLIKWIVLWNPITAAYDAPAKGIALSRFCSGNLAPRSAFHDHGTHRGYRERLYMNGEEINGGRGFAHDVESGVSYELPRMGKMNFENLVARPESGAKTIVAATDDGRLGEGEVVLYVGRKTASGSPVQRAGLTNGTLLGLVVAGYPVEPTVATIPSGTPVTMYDLGDVSALSGTELQALHVAHGVTGFNRPEDIAWNPRNGNQLFFHTTANITNSTRLWRVTFCDGRNPAAGGTLDLLVDGNSVAVDGVNPRMLDNLTVSNDGRWVYMQEDPGNQPRLAKLWRFDLASNTLELLAQHDPARFDPLVPGFMTQDEESSGIIDASEWLGPGKFLLDVQVHKPNPDPSLVEFGQLLVMSVED